MVQRTVIFLLFLLASCQTSRNLSISPQMVVMEQRGDYVKVESIATPESPYRQRFVIHWPEKTAKGDTLMIKFR